MLEGDVAARLLLDRLLACHSSPTVLFLLNLRESTLERTEMGSMLLRLCRELDVNPVQGRSFFRFVQQSVGSVAPICPDFRSVHRKKNEAVAGFREQLSSRRSQSAGDPFAYLGAFMPFCFQCLKSKAHDSAKGGSSSLFFCFATPEDAVIQMHEIMCAGFYVHEEVKFYFTQVPPRFPRFFGSLFLLFPFGWVRFMSIAWG